MQNLLVIDTFSQPTDLEKYQTLILLTKNHISFLNNQGEIKVRSLAEIKDFTLNQEKFNLIWRQVSPYLDWIVPLVVMIILTVVPLITISGKFVYLLVFSLFSWLIAKLLKLKPISYTKALQINLQAITLPALIIFVFRILSARLQIPFFQSILLLIFNLIIFNSLRSKA